MSRKNWREYWYKKCIWKEAVETVRPLVPPGAQQKGWLQHLPHLLQGLHGEVDAAASGGEWQVLLGHGLHLLHDDIRLLHFPGDLSSFPLQVLQGGYDCVVIQNSSFHLVQSL